MSEYNKKILMIVMDGLGDRACDELRGFTPLQYVRTPNLDWFAEHGCAGVCDPISPGVKPGSDTAHMSLLGYDPFECYTGRGALEALGTGADMRKGDIALRCNFATVNEHMEVIDRRAGRIGTAEASVLAKAVDGMVVEDVECRVKESVEHRAVLVLRGPGLSTEVSDPDPMGGEFIQPVKAYSEEAAKTARVLNRFIERSNEILRDHPLNIDRTVTGMPPANILIPRGAGTYPDMAPFQERYGLKGACVAGVGLIKGLGRACGLDLVELPPECDGTIRSDFRLKATCALKALEDHDFVLMNIKAPDIAGHDMDAKSKAEVVKRLDSMAGFIRDSMPDNLVVVFTCDHCTPCRLGDHSGDPVPLVIYSRGCVRDEAEEFSESGCPRGSIGRIRGMDLIPICMDMANRNQKFGA